MEALRPPRLPRHKASGYLNGVVHGGSSSSTASAAQGSRLSKSGSAPSLVEAAAVKLENQRLREEIRAMCTTIKSQSSQLSDLWAETQRLQARKDGKRSRTASNVSNLMAGVAELSRMQLDPGNACGGRSGLSRARSAGSISGADADGVFGWSANLGQPKHGAFEVSLPPALAEAPNSKGMRDGTIAQAPQAFGQNPFPSQFSELSQDRDSSKGLPPTLAFDLYKLHNSSKMSFGERSGHSNKRLPLFTPKIMPLPENYRDALDRAEQHGRATAAHGDAAAHNLRFPADAGLCASQPFAGARREASYGAMQDTRGSGPGSGGILEPSTLQESHVELPRGAVSLFILAQNLNLSMLSAKTELATRFRSTIQEDIAQNLGPGFLPEHVDVRLLAESAAIPVTITAPKGVSCYDLHRWLCNKPLRWGAGNKLGTLEGFNAICLSPSWCLSTVGMPSIVADEASTTVSGGSPLDDGKGTNLAQDLPAIPDEQDLILPRSLQRSGHTPRDGPQRKVSPKKRPLPKAPASTAKVKRNPREAKDHRENSSSARQLNFSGLSDTPYYQPMLLGEGFGEEKEHISGLFVPGVDTSTFDSRVNSPEAEKTRDKIPARNGGHGVVTQPRLSSTPAATKSPAYPVFSRQNTSDEDVPFIEDDSVGAGAAPAGLAGPRRSGVEQPNGPMKRLASNRSRTSSSRSAHVPESHQKVEHKEEAPAPLPAPAPTVVPGASATQDTGRSSGSLHEGAISSKQTPVEKAPDVPKAATAVASTGEKTSTEAPKSTPPEAEVVLASDSEESESESDASSESEEESADGVTEAGPRRKSTSAEVKDLIGDMESSSDSESDVAPVERSELPTVRTRAESLLSKE